MKRLLAVLVVLVVCPLFAADLTRDRLSDQDVASLSLHDLRLMRGEVFGRHGRIFGADPDIDKYLRSQSWYKPVREFSNSSLTELDRANLDVIRRAEALRHEKVEPGDLRWWQNLPLSEEKLGAHSGLEWRVMLAEVEAIHGKSFPDQPTLQNYFYARYWYRESESYDPRVLSKTERDNLAVMEAAMRKQRKLTLVPGDMYAWTDKRIKPEMLDGLGLHELRLLRNEIYARHGRIYRTPWLANWFQGQTWYEEKDDYTDEMLSRIERDNAAIIAARERELHDALSTSKIDPAMLEGLFTEDLRRLRNEIYARHGRVFKDAELRGYFSSFDWYKPDPAFQDASLSKIELANAATIRRLEDGADSRVNFEG